jgi:hypothetical protein
MISHISYGDGKLTPGLWFSAFVHMAAAAACKGKVPAQAPDSEDVEPGWEPCSFPQARVFLLLGLTHGLVTSCLLSHLLEWLPVFWILDLIIGYPAHSALVSRI